MSERCLFYAGVAQRQSAYTCRECFLSMWAVSQVCGATSLWSALGLFASREEERRYNMQRSETECSKHLKVSTAATFHAVFLIFFHHSLHFSAPLFNHSALHQHIGYPCPATCNWYFEGLQRSTFAETHLHLWDQKLH